MSSRLKLNVDNIGSNFCIMYYLLDASYNNSLKEITTEKEKD